jgi:hypothetical protein
VQPDGRARAQPTPLPLTLQVARLLLGLAQSVEYPPPSPGLTLPEVEFIDMCFWKISRFLPSAIHKRVFQRDFPPAIDF